MYSCRVLHDNISCLVLVLVLVGFSLLGVIHLVGFFYLYCFLIVFTLDLHR